MLAEVNAAKDFLQKKFNGIDNVEQGVYAIPYETSKGSAFMRVEITADMGMKGFELFKDEELTKSWYDIDSDVIIDNHDKKIEPHTRIIIPVGAIEFNAGSNTIWVQNTDNGTTLRIKCTGKINVDNCNNSPISHCDIMVEGDINFCISDDAER